MIQVITEMSDLQNIVNKTGGKTAVDFSASWCGPCKRLYPLYEELSNNPLYSSISFIKVDVDDAQEISDACNISSLPTIQFYMWSSEKNQADLVDEILGFNPNELKKCIEKLSSSLIA
jgi:thiol-disulfide isomerase/thioredoxin